MPHDHTRAYIALRDRQGTTTSEHAGGVTVSYFEWVQNRAGDRWTEDVVNERLSDVMHRRFGEVLKLARQHRVSMGTAAYVLSVDRVAAAHRLRGLHA